VIMNTCRIVRKFSAEQWTRSAWSVRQAQFENRLSCCEVRMWITIIMITKTTVTCDSMWRNAHVMHSARILSDDGGTALAAALCGLRCSENWWVTRFTFWTRDATRVVVCWKRDAVDCIGFCRVSSAARIEYVVVHWILWRLSILSVYGIGIYGYNWL
jgi:hypothetical protein